MNKPTAGRAKIRDLSEAIYSPKDSDEIELELHPFNYREVVIYTMFGKHHELDSQKYPLLFDIKYEDGQIEVAEESLDAFAKMTHFGNQTRYYIKAGSGGHFFNPLGMYEGAGHNNNRKRLGRSEWNFIEVPHKCFKLYLNFLKTKNRAFLTNAEREVL